MLNTSRHVFIFFKWRTWRLCCAKETELQFQKFVPNVLANNLLLYMVPILIHFIITDSILFITNLQEYSTRIILKVYILPTINNLLKSGAVD